MIFLLVCQCDGLHPLTFEAQWDFLKGILTAMRRRDGSGVGVRKQKWDCGDQFKNAWINHSERWWRHEPGNVSKKWCGKDTLAVIFSVGHGGETKRRGGRKSTYMWIDMSEVKCGLRKREGYPYWPKKGGIRRINDLPSPSLDLWSASDRTPWANPNWKAESQGVCWVGPCMPVSQAQSREEKVGKCIWVMGQRKDPALLFSRVQWINSPALASRTSELPGDAKGWTSHFLLLRVPPTT